jgi:hypothetical protein
MLASDFRKIDLVCSDDEGRPELQCVYLHEGHLYAADGFIAARLPAHPTDQDSDGLIPKRAIAIARDADSTITANETVRVAAYRCTFDRPEADFWSESIGRLNKVILRRPGAKPETHKPTITLDVQRLWDLTRAICQEHPWLEIYPGQTNHDPVLVKPVRCHDDTLGAIMPMCPPQRPGETERADLWQALGRLREHIDNEAEDVKLCGDLLAELRKALCVEEAEGEP